jgi:organic hydroperoxide reductase OsmC/OhrA
MASLYSTNAAASSDPHGAIRSEDGLLDLKLARPCVLCGRDDTTNPDQLFAGGYAACFQNALLYVTWDADHRSSDDDIDAVAALIERPRVGRRACSDHRRQCAAERPAHGVHAICRSRMRSGAISMWRSPPRSRAFIQLLGRKPRE